MSSVFIKAEVSYELDIPVGVTVQEAFDDFHEEGGTFYYKGTIIGSLEDGSVIGVELDENVCEVCKKEGPLAYWSTCAACDPEFEEEEGVVSQEIARRFP